MIRPGFEVEQVIPTPTETSLVINRPRASAQRSVEEVFEFVQGPDSALVGLQHKMLIMKIAERDEVLGLSATITGKP